MVCFVYVYSSAGGIYTAEMSFPDDYPMSPPVVKFISNFWHPNGIVFDVVNV